MPPRLAIVALAGVLGFGSAWLVAAESSRAGAGYFPKDAAAATSFAATASSAELAASIGWPRGDLAAEHAVAVYADDMTRRNGGAAHSAASLKATNLPAIHLAPYDARPWLILAEQENDPSRRQQILKMSYYTAPASAHLFPQRFRLSAMQQPIDAELRTLVEFEIGMLLQQSDDFDADLEKIYRATAGSEREFLEQLLNAAAPGTLIRFRTQGR